MPGYSLDRTENTTLVGNAFDFNALDKTATATEYFEPGQVGLIQLVPGGIYVPDPTGFQTPAFVQGNSFAGGGTPVTSQGLAFSANVTAGDLIVVAFGWVQSGGPAGMTVTDSQSNSYSYSPSGGPFLLSSIGYLIQTAYTVAASTGSLTVTLTSNTGSAPFCRFLIHEYSGTSNTVDAVNTTTWSTVNFTTFAVTTVAGPDVFFVWGVDNSGFTVVDAPATIRETAGSESTADMMTTTPGVYTMNLRPSGGGGGAVAVCFLAATGGTTVNGTGSGAITFAGSGIATVTVQGTGSGAIVFGGSGTATVTVIGTGSGAIVFAGAGTATAAYVETGTGAIVFGGSGTAILLYQPTGSGAIVFGASGTAGVALFPTGTGAITFGGSGTASVTVTPTGTGAIVFGGGTATATITVKPTGTGAITFDGSGTGQILGFTVGTGAIVFSGAGTATVTVVGTGTGAMVFGATAAVQVVLKASGTGAVSFGGAGIGAIIIRGTGTIVFGGHGIAGTTGAHKPPLQITIALGDAVHTVAISLKPRPGVTVRIPAVGSANVPGPDVRSASVPL